MDTSSINSPAGVWLLGRLPLWPKRDLMIMKVNFLIVFFIDFDEYYYDDDYEDSFLVAGFELFSIF